MNDPLQTILDSALALTEPEREILVERLLESLSPEQKELNDDELFAELERRRAEYEKDPSSAIPWSEFRWDEGE